MTQTNGCEGIFAAHMNIESQSVRTDCWVYMTVALVSLLHV